MIVVGFDCGANEVTGSNQLCNCGSPHHATIRRHGLRQKNAGQQVTSGSYSGYYDGPMGHDSLMVKVTDSWLVGHEFEPGTTEDRYTLNMWRLKRSPIGEVRKLGERVPAQMSS
ncbi:hypothetical protein TNCV_1444911 [Trichonephila clavipes]|nr:hypothetical protein TNCV_1444911 [Trichonephila clavipes]